MHADKGQARRHWREQRQRAASGSDAAAVDARIRDHLVAVLAEHRSPGRSVVALYRGLGSEIDPSPVAGLLPALGWVPAFPRVEDLWLEIVIALPGDLRPGHRGILEPIGPGVSVSALAAIVVPGVAFTADGRRLGQGGGHYDRLLEQVRSAGGAPPLVIGLCRSSSLADDLPVEAHDQAVDAVLTEHGFAPAR